MTTEHDNEHTGEELARVHYLPTHDATDSARPVEAEVVEGELVTDEEYQRLTSQKAQAIARYQGYKHDLVVVGRLTRRVATHERTRAVLRHAVAYPVAGVGVAWRRWRDTHGAGRYERQMRAAEAAGDEEKLRYWQEADVAEKQRRHDRVMDWLRAPAQWIKAAAIGAAGMAGLLLVLGIILAINSGELADVVAPISGVVHAIAFVVWFVVTYGVFLLLGGTAAGIAYLYFQGRQHAEMPSWLASRATPAEGRDTVPDEGAILAALRELGYGPLTRAFKEGWQPRWVSPTTRVGRGYHTQLLLPRQVPVEEIAKRKGVLAHNLLRKPIEVWPTEPKDQPGVLDLWVADQGILTGPVDAWPLLHEGSTDYFTGVPVAVDARGEQITGKLMACNYLVAGIMGSGKSSLVICLLLGAMLDPLVDIDVHVLAYNVDYDPMKPRLRTLVKGDEEEHIEAAMATLRNLVGEVSERGRILEELGGEEAKLTRDIAERDPRMRPRVVVFDEVHELFTHKQHGEEAKELALKVTKKARKTGITLLWVTPDADANSLPRGISKTASHRVAFAINDHQGNDAILGTGMHKRGYSATTLVAGEDVGTAMAAGFAKVPGLIRSHYVRKEKGLDEITPVVERALALRDQAGITATTPKLLDAAEADPLADIAAVLGQAPRMKTREVLQHLAERNPAVYRDWTPQRLTAYLAEHNAAPYKTEGAMQVSAARIREALTERNHNDDTDTDDHDDED
ncbi:S-DNA-T family DNA segregation ATPase FtsK/SpoIIIE [Prauserella shujinwangii]|uniref:S-DNA-T family DNA segregation ATPase FtsK/SpoIIIE n=1 Tax=Prauserella shujinwangii TaxID=1453103 RepID=A0A2T0LLH1_9PSEU|nr:FtsK/SpoIIIE domain-containing protein [Prauserella shujinwangii]PRX43838.1 S-DNA-T family DNA segregation ATPase FtsK/SpoIIIE [Prauserella shujinwangii]